MHLSDLSDLEIKHGVEFHTPDNFPDFEITGLSCNSKECKDGFLFAALAGTKVNGADFIDDAIKNGAKIILAGRDVHIEAGIAFIKHDNPRLILGVIASIFYGRQPDNIVAVTGTNGKTSVAHFCRQIWSSLGYKSASIGTLGIIERDDEDIGQDSQLTTPDSIQLHKSLATLKDKGVNHVAMEASSHGLEQSRLAGVNIKVGAFTNISRDHLDYHKTFENYFNAKMLLFSEIMQKGEAILNADVEEFLRISTICKDGGHKVTSYGMKGADITLLESEILPHGQRMKVSIDATEYDIITDLIGVFQASNLLCALGMVIASGIEPEKAIEACNSITSVPGRMEIAATHISGAPIIVDYAHTPDALEKVLIALRPHAARNLIVVFGCGGDRDSGKRPVMGEIASNLADIAIVTDDNPRTEEPAAIRKQIMEKCKNGKEIGDRSEAIKYAVGQLKKGDLLVIAGKGHEKYQIVGKDSVHFDDVEEAKRAVAL